MAGFRKMISLTLALVTSWVFLTIKFFLWAHTLDNFKSSDSFDEVKSSDSLQVKRSYTLHKRSLDSSSVLHGYDLPPTLPTCNVSELYFDESIMSTEGLSQMLVPNRTERIAYGPWLPKCGSTTIAEMLRHIGKDKYGIEINSSAVENDYTFVSFLRHPLERALSAISEMEYLYRMGWINNHLKRNNLTWWNTSCINTTWGYRRRKERPRCRGSVPSRSITTRLKRLDAFLNDVELQGYWDWHVVPVSYLMSINPVVQKARNLLYFNVKDEAKVEKALSKAFNVSYEPSAKNVKPISNPEDPNGMHWMVRWTELVDWADTIPLAQTIIDKLCSLYRPDVECLPFEVPECSKDDSTTDIKGISFFEDWRDNRIRELVNQSTVIFWKKEFFIQKYFANFTDRVDRKKLKNERKVWKDTSRDIVYDTICQAAKRLKRKGQLKPHILFSSLGDNWGALSTYVPGRTKNWNDLDFNLGLEGCTIHDVFDYLNYQNTLAVFTTQHQKYYHPKVHSVPLGVEDGAWVVESLRRERVNRTHLLMINDSGRQHRKNISLAVLKNFRGTVNNTYGITHEEYHNEMRRSKFVLCPSGHGWDSNRIWEALYMGAIPIVELYGRDEDGWRRTLKDLPVLWVDRLENVTPELLESEYNGIVKRAQKYSYEKLTTTWWIDFVQSFRQTPFRSHI